MTPEKLILMKRMQDLITQLELSGLKYYDIIDSMISVAVMQMKRKKGIVATQRYLKHLQLLVSKPTKRENKP